MGPPKDLVTSDVTDTSFAVSWTAAPGAVKAYNIRWRSPFSGEAGDKMLPGDVTDTLLDGLSPETLYHISVVAAYERGGSEPLAGQETTDGEGGRSGGGVGGGIPDKQSDCFTATKKKATKKK